MRILTPYERNQLRKYHLPEEKLKKTEIPVEYVTGFVEFMGLELYVSPATLIPRIETEELVNMAIQKAIRIFEKTLENRENAISHMPINNTLKIVDVGTGSGAISIVVAHRLQKMAIPFEIIATDISSKALKIAKKNLQKIDNSLAITFVESNLLSQLGITNNKIDLIVANLPYIPSSRIPKLSSSVKDFEPHLALDGGKDGLNLVRNLLKQARSKLSNNGIILLELDITHTQEKMAEFSQKWKIEAIKSKHDGVNFMLLSKKII